MLCIVLFMVVIFSFFKKKSKLFTKIIITFLNTKHVKRIKGGYNLKIKYTIESVTIFNSIHGYN